jgi:hypothetical protein
MRHHSKHCAEAAVSVIIALCTFGFLLLLILRHSGYKF